MSNLNDFKSDSTLTHIRSLSIGNARGRDGGSYNESQQQITLHADTKVLKIRRRGGGNWNLAYTLDGSSITLGTSWEGTGSPTPSRYIGNYTDDSDYNFTSLKVSGGETFKYEFVDADGTSTPNGETMIIEEWKY